MNSPDIIVIGAGPAGMIASGRAAELGKNVALLEKNVRPGEKLLITGGGRCNVTNAEFDIRRLSERYGKRGKALIGPFTRFGPEQTISFFEERGLRTKIEAEKRAFPITDKAEDVWNVMVAYASKTPSSIMHQAVDGFVMDGKKITAVKLKTGALMQAKNFILTTGGMSHPETGSTGDGFRWLQEIGHTVIQPESALVPLAIQEKWVHALTGISLAKAKITVLLDGKPQQSDTGKMLFTHFGISGPLVLNMSKGVGDLLESGTVMLSVDLLPKFDGGAADRMLLELIEMNKNKMLKNALPAMFEKRLSDMLIAITKIDPDTYLYRLTAEQRRALVQAMKDIRMTVTGLLGKDKAVVTSGGVALDEVDFRTMRSKLHDNLFLAGDILDFDRPSGGFSLQICWTTGWIAGESAAT